MHCLFEDIGVSDMGDAHYARIVIAFIEHGRQEAGQPRRQLVSIMYLAMNQ